MTNKICSNCGYENSEQNLYCQSCGQKLQATTGQDPTPRQKTSLAAPPPGTGSVYSTPQTNSQIPGIGTIQINKLGSRKMSWSGLIDGAADKTVDVMQLFMTELQTRQIPQANILNANVTTGDLNSIKRNFLIIQSYTGATLTANIAPYGRDLYLTWALYIHKIYKWLYIGIMGGIAALLAIIPAYDRFGFHFSSWILYFVVWALIIVIGALVLGNFLRNNPKFLFVEEMDTFAQDDITAMELAVHSAILNAAKDAGLDTSCLPPFDAIHERRSRVSF